MRLEGKSSSRSDGVASAEACVRLPESVMKSSSRSDGAASTEACVRLLVHSSTTASNQKVTRVKARYTVSPRLLLSVSEMSDDAIIQSIDLVHDRINLATRASVMESLSLQLSL